MNFTTPMNLPESLPERGPLLHMAIDCVNKVKAWRDCDGNDGFPQDLRDQIELVLTVFELRQKELSHLYTKSEQDKIIELCERNSGVCVMAHDKESKNHEPCDASNCRSMRGHSALLNPSPERTNQAAKKVASGFHLEWDKLSDEGKHTMRGIALNVYSAFKGDSE